jgi:hypothetical protein
VTAESSSFKGGVGREPDGFGESPVHQVRQKSFVIPAGEGWPAKLHKVDFYAVPDDILSVSVEKRFLRLKLVEGGEDEIHAKNTNRFLPQGIRRISQVDVPNTT